MNQSTDKLTARVNELNTKLEVFKTEALSPVNSTQQKKIFLEDSKHCPNFEYIINQDLMITLQKELSQIQLDFLKQSKNSEIDEKIKTSIRRARKTLDCITNTSTKNDFSFNENSKELFGKPNYEVCGIAMVFLKKLFEMASLPECIEAASYLNKNLKELLRYSDFWKNLESTATVSIKNNLMGLNMDKFYFSFESMIRHISGSLTEGLDGKIRNFRSVFNVLKNIYIIKGETSADATNHAWDIAIETYQGTTGYSPFYNHEVISDLESDYKAYKLEKSLS